MAKIKTKSSAKKRFKVTKSGKILRHRNNVGHNTGSKRSKHMNRLTKEVEVPKSLKKKVEKALGLKG
ncbi:MAG: bL35 family ribosomal protein [Defluviitoga tunisiensis]|jgi:large subunit ribosomal protein L35|uniref:Large ribosomal subunit protein bL35 n=1 Tax=Defluviitoga tunisiensis TaxID=1006576 RepID=A0A0C7NWX7_DEFTU|nr:50S ribosomal protein L35 [Defluviitoga tunisiensis]MDD3601446.1 50S ribosomal protein L35 [Defluviitoga tunisiensis]MDY0379160.1 bL35 family ribosomal protein [Defluviitoga tunisiensis]CEP77868.1 50S ribosomal protein L35 [Defluviitoga tunisiensis]HHV01008.1 50S ribosomal protein L35 [Defluviitoga tunisiensis]HOB54805.1 bL35 family ribosomal protein [Defluviitoga tunisiensis]